MAGRLVGQGVGEGDADRPGLRTDQQVDVGNLVAVADQGFTDEHGHGCTPSSMVSISPRGKPRAGGLAAVCGGGIYGADRRNGRVKPATGKTSGSRRCCRLRLRVSDGLPETRGWRRTGRGVEPLRGACGASQATPPRVRSHRPRAGRQRSTSAVAAPQINETPKTGYLFAGTSLLECSASWS